MLLISRFHACNAASHVAWFLHPSRGTTCGPYAWRDSRTMMNCHVSRDFVKATICRNGGMIYGQNEQCTTRRVLAPTMSSSSSTPPSSPSLSTPPSSERFAPARNARREPSTSASESSRSASQVPSLRSSSSESPAPLRQRARRSSASKSSRSASQVPSLRSSSSSESPAPRRQKARARSSSSSESSPPGRLLSARPLRATKAPTQQAESFDPGFRGVEHHATEHEYPTNLRTCDLCRFWKTGLLGRQERAIMMYAWGNRRLGWLAATRAKRSA